MAWLRKVVAGRRRFGARPRSFVGAHNCLKGDRQTFYQHRPKTSTRILMATIPLTEWWLIVLGVLILILGFWWALKGPRVLCSNCGASTKAPKPDGVTYCPVCGAAIFGEQLQRQQPAVTTQPTIQIVQPPQSTQVRKSIVRPSARLSRFAVATVEHSSKRN